MVTLSGYALEMRSKITATHHSAQYFFTFFFYLFLSCTNNTKVLTLIGQNVRSGAHRLITGR